MQHILHTDHAEVKSMADHPLANDPYVASPEAIAQAREEAAKERAEVAEAVRQYDLEKLEALDLLGDLIVRFTAKRIETWLKFKARELGQELD